jgi:hypothetical protein
MSFLSGSDGDLTSDSVRFDAHPTLLAGALCGLHRERRNETNSKNLEAFSAFFISNFHCFVM